MAEQIIRIMCPNLRCRSVLGVPAEARGRMVRCRHCGTNIRIPNKQQPEAAPPKPAEGANQAPPAAA